MTYKTSQMCVVRLCSVNILETPRLRDRSADIDEIRGAYSASCISCIF